MLSNLAMSLIIQPITTHLYNRKRKTVLYLVERLVEVRNSGRLTYKSTLVRKEEVLGLKATSFLATMGIFTALARAYGTIGQKLF